MTVHRPQALAEFSSHGRNGTDCRSVAIETYTSNGTLYTEVLKSLDSGFRRLRVRFPGRTATSTLSDRAKAAALVKW